jgi:hypothetical protein
MRTAMRRWMDTREEVDTRTWHGDTWFSVIQGYDGITAFMSGDVKALYELD